MSRIISVTTPQERPRWRSEFSFVDADRFDTSTLPTAAAFGSLAGGCIPTAPGAWGRTAGTPGAIRRGGIIPAAPAAFTACSLPLLDTMRMTFRGAPAVPVAARPAVRTGPSRLATVAPPRPRRLPIPRGGAISVFIWLAGPGARGAIAAPGACGCCCCCPARLTMTTFFKTGADSACCAGAGAAGLMPSRCFTLPPALAAAACGFSAEVPAAALGAVLATGGCAVDCSCCSNKFFCRCMAASLRRSSLMRITCSRSFFCSSIFRRSSWVAASSSIAGGSVAFSGSGGGRKSKIGTSLMLALFTVRAGGPWLGFRGMRGASRRAALGGTATGGAGAGLLPKGSRGGGC